MSADRLRARLALRLIGWARSLLRLSKGGIDPDWDTCTHCGATGCESGTVEHAPDCPLATGVHVATLQDMWPFGPAVCQGCDTVLWPGSHYSHIARGEIEGIPVGEVACLGCVAQKELGL